MKAGVCSVGDLVSADHKEACWWNPTLVGAPWLSGVLPALPVLPSTLRRGQLWKISAKSGGLGGVVEILGGSMSMLQVKIWAVTGKSINLARGAVLSLNSTVLGAGADTNIPFDDIFCGGPKSTRVFASAPKMHQGQCTRKVLHVVLRRVAWSRPIFLICRQGWRFDACCLLLGSRHGVWTGPVSLTRRQGWRFYYNIWMRFSHWLWAQSLAMGSLYWHTKLLPHWLWALLEWINANVQQSPMRWSRCSPGWLSLCSGLNQGATPNDF